MKGRLGRNKVSVMHSRQPMPKICKNMQFLHVKSPPHSSRKKEGILQSNTNS